MKKYKITVNGKTYDVEVIDVSENEKNLSSQIPKISISSVKHQESKAAEKIESKPAPSSVSKEAVEGASPVKAPMPGTILSINVKVGDKVEKGDTVIILEAMKMENEITAEISGTVKAINVQKGTAVVQGDTLIQIG